MSLRSLFEWKTDVGIHTINGSMRGMSLVQFPQSTQIYCFMNDGRDNTLEKRRFDALKRMYEAFKSSDEWSSYNYQQASDDYDSTFPWEGMGN